MTASIAVRFSYAPLSEQVLATRVGHRPQGTWCFAGETDEEGIVSVPPVKEAGT